MVIKKTLLLDIILVFSFFEKNQISTFNIVESLLVLSWKSTIFWSFWNTQTWPFIEFYFFKYSNPMVISFWKFSNTWNYRFFDFHGQCLNRIRFFNIIFSKVKWTMLLEKIFHILKYSHMQDNQAFERNIFKCLGQFNLGHG